MNKNKSTPTKPEHTKPRKAEPAGKKSNHEQKRNKPEGKKIPQNFNPIAVLFDSAASDEKKKRRDLDRNYKQKSNNIRQYEKRALRNLARESAQAARDYEEERQQRWEEAQEEIKEANRPLYEQIRTACLEKKEAINKSINELKAWQEKQKEAAKNEQEYYNRYRSTNYILRKIEERIYQFQAYIQYLDNYCRGLERSFDKRGSVLKPFENTLPENYPYAGKIYYLRKSDFSEENNGERGKTYTAVLFQFETTYKISVKLPREEILEFEKLSDSAEYPFMFNVVVNKKDNRRLYYLSYKLGEIKASIGTASGIKATVTSIYKEKINLIYKNFSHNPIFLEKKDLVRNKKTPVGSTLQVYVKDYDTLLKKITVTEKIADSLVINYFSEIVLSMTSEQCTELRNFIEEKNIPTTYDNDWVFRPIGKKITNLTEIILSNSYYAIKAAFEYVGENKNKLILVYRELIEDVSSFPKDEMFVSAKIVLRVFNRSDVKKNPDAYEQYFDECLRLRIYLIDDFLTQKNLGQTNSEMGIFIDKWSRLTAETLNNTKFSIAIPLTVMLEKPFENKITVLHIKKNKKIEQEYNKKDYKPKYYIKIGDRDDIPVNLSKRDDEYFLNVRANITSVQLEKYNNTVHFYETAELAPLIRQLDELQNFKIRRPANERVKDAVLEPENIVYRNNSQQIKFFYNESIGKNKFQEYAVKKAFSAMDFFIIQGPPGTGKTTVIRELVLQYILQNHAPRILIASQTNVAVDNVIKGLDDFIKYNSGFGLRENQIIRCGDTEKMREEIKKYSFDSRFEDYKKQFEIEVPNNPVVNSLRKEWKNLLNQDETKTVAKNYFIKNFNIVGATCVGLANGYYGLQDLDFDLVIIDEAGKALPGEAIIPINKAKKLILIGDHKQLPPYIDPKITDNDNLDSTNIINNEEREYFFKKSFFERIFTKCPEESKAMLKIQFRMPPIVAGLVNKFYDDSLENGISCNDKKPLLLDSHLIFIDMANEAKYREEKTGNKFLPLNSFEPEVVERIVIKIREFYSGRIVVITPYRGQKRCIIKKLGNKYGHTVVDTIDAFQGDEEQVVIYCTTRAIQKTRYFSDDARLNVAFSRTKNTLILIGSSKYLGRYDEDKKVHQAFEYIKQNGRCIPYSTLINPNFSIKNKKSNQV